MLQPFDLGLILSYQCQSACAHCLYTCGPRRHGWMALEEMRRAFQVIKAWGAPGQMHLTGGEPFLNYPLLLEAVRAAADLGIPLYVETNAGWCVEPENVLRRFEELRHAGLCALQVSCSPFHAVSIPLKRTLLAIQAGQAVFGSQGVMVYLPQWIEHVASFGMNELVPLERYIQAYGAQRAGEMFWQGYGLIPGGRCGYDLGYLATLRPAADFAGEDCRLELLHAPHSHFDLFGNFIPSFCGGLSLGDWHNLPRVLEDCRSGRIPPLLRTLVDEGPHGLYCQARRWHGYEPLAQGYAGKCHLCVDVRRCLALLGDYAELQPMDFYDPGVW